MAVRKESIPKSEEQKTIDSLGNQLVETELQNLQLQTDNQTLGQQVVDLDLRLMNGGL